MNGIIQHQNHGYPFLKTKTTLYITQYFSIFWWGHIPQNLSLRFKYLLFIFQDRPELVKKAISITTMFVSSVSVDHSTMAVDRLRNYLFSLLSIVSTLKWGCNFMLRFCLFPYQIPAATIAGDDFKLGTRNYNCNKHDENEDVECAICLCKIDEDDEIRELRCDHLFHKVCLDRWVGYRRSTCPICRSSLIPRQLVSGMEVILFKYCSFDDSSHRETWWLR